MVRDLLYQKTFLLKSIQIRILLYAADEATGAAVKPYLCCLLEVEVEEDAVPENERIVLKHKGYSVKQVQQCSIFGPVNATKNATSQIYSATTSFYALPLERQHRSPATRRYPCHLLLFAPVVAYPLVTLGRG